MQLNNNNITDQYPSLPNITSENSKYEYSKGALLRSNLLQHNRID